MIWLQETCAGAWTTPLWPGWSPSTSRTAVFSTEDKPPFGDEIAFKVLTITWQSFPEMLLLFYKIETGIQIIASRPHVLWPSMPSVFFWTARIKKLRMWHSQTQNPLPYHKIPQKLQFAKKNDKDGNWYQLNDNSQTHPHTNTDILVYRCKQELWHLKQGFYLFSSNEPYNTTLAFPFPHALMFRKGAFVALRGLKGLKTCSSILPSTLLFFSVLCICFLLNILFGKEYLGKHHLKTIILYNVKDFA